MAREWTGNWEDSWTGQFGKKELEQLRDSSIEELIHRLSKSDPVVVLRALGEIIAHKDDAKAEALLRNPKVKGKCDSVIAETFSPDMFVMLLVVQFAQRKGIK